MLDLLKKEANKTLTENGAVTYETTSSDCLDLFATVGALRQAGKSDIKDRFIRAYAENPDIAMKILFYGRDIRGGLGERRVFRTILNYLAKNNTSSVIKNIPYIAEYGRFDDLLLLLDTPCEKEAIAYLKNQLDLDLEACNNGESISLLAKWLPSVNASNGRTRENAIKIAKAFNMSLSEYRKTLSKLRAYTHIIENNLREKDYSFDYEKQPSKALFKYKQAFIRNDKEKYMEFIQKASEGTAKLHADNVAPYELIDPYIRYGRMEDVSEEVAKVLNATWEALPDYGSDEDAIAVVDTSGSMYGYQSPSPASVALSLGLYFAEHNKGRFKNHFIEFSDKPQLIEIKGKTFVDKLRYLTTFSRVADTNLEAMFDLILNTAKDNNLKQEELPGKLVIITDMEFNCCVEDASLTNFENAKRKYAACGYKLPDVVFWNVASRNKQQPVTMNEQGVALVSGCTPKLFEMIASNELSPYKFMLDVIGSERYAKIVA
ncbi:MAG: DUF2828 family protein [Lachnospiraceae bacterium]|nr:DUF2828 family protein [Lachnospiraceae bacterium]